MRDLVLQAYAEYEATEPNRFVGWYPDVSTVGRSGNPPKSFGS